MISSTIDGRHRVSPQTVLVPLLLILLCALLATTPDRAIADVHITAAGSTALLPLLTAAARLYQVEHPDVKLDVSGGGSLTGINKVSVKAVDIGDSDVSAPGHSELRDNRIAVIGFAVITNPNVGLQRLSRSQIRGLFDGQIRNWKQVGGPDEPVVTVNRPRSSGTRAVFSQTIMRGDVVDESGVTEDATATVVKIVRETRGAISYAAFSGTRGSGLTEIEIDDVPATDESVISGKYPFWSYEHMFTFGPPSADVARFIAFVRRRRDLLEKNGYIRISDMKVTESDR